MSHVHEPDSPRPAAEREEPGPAGPARPAGPAGHAQPQAVRREEPTTRHVPVAPGQDVLELRIHGMANTPPHHILDLPADEVVQTDGDGLGSFWVPTPEADARDREPAPGDMRDRAVPAGDPHEIRNDVRREAYSWGAMSRLGRLPLGGVLGVVGTVATRVMWVAIVPFGLANAGYWARRIPPALREPTAGRILPDPSAALTRVFALLLTLLFTTTTATVALSTIGTRCMGAVTGETVSVCARIPDELYWLARLDHGDRLGWLSLVTVVAVAVLVLIAHSGSVKFESRVSALMAGETAVSTDGPVLRRPGFWTRRTGTGALYSHLAAALGLLSALMLWTSERTAWAAAPGFAVAMVATWIVALRTDDDGVQVEVPRWKPRAAFALLVGGLLVWAGAWVTLAGSAPPAETPRLIGIEATPGLLVVALTGIASAALVWRRARRPGPALTMLWLLPPLVATACTAVATLAAPGGQPLPITVRAVLLTVAVAALAVPAGWAVARRRANGSRAEGWGGAGPGVFLLLSTAAAAIFSSLAVVGVQWYLRSAPTGVVVPESRGGLFLEVVIDADPGEIVPVPPVYTEFGASVAVILVVSMLLLAALVAPAAVDAVRSGTLWIPPAVNTSGPRRGPGARAARAAGRGLPGVRAGDVIEPGLLNPAALRALRARQLAAMSHRSELAVSALAVASWIALVATVPLAVSPGDLGDPATLALPGFIGDPAGLFTVPAWLTALAVPMLGTLAAALVASALAGALANDSRPWGLLWDVLCFLPRSAHPFGPPSYAERAVPEVRSRVDSWLTAVDVDDDAYREALARRRRVVLSAHSIGGVLAAAVVLIRSGNPVHRQGLADGRVGLLTYGVQLRPYFGRFFPELLGPGALGLPPVGPPAWSGDPWRADDVDLQAAPASEFSLRGLLVPGVTAGNEAPGDEAAGAEAAEAGRPAGPPAWINLWRRTDFLGFPVVGYEPNEIDRGAEEVDRAAYLFEVGLHGGYPRTAAYQEAFDEVVSRLDHT
ncbi:hypothetical protein [Myceligenerans salitolerans]|uniref:Uncharacterized protein n=1 Tax=Myceligenerans salitolerans TaxID=1230528 RepID=A0ABS3I5P9_9MICO|nr:hypothetical protein [Myceligenerans salitolerans]MBO0608335.1 hypothetical protein [Myceligenerans salitolerans]